MDTEYTNRSNEHHRATTRYSQLPNNDAISFSNIDIDRGSSHDRWNYGIGFAKPNGLAPKKYSNYIITDTSQYIMPNDIYKLPTQATVKKYLENEFNPSIITPENAKLSIDPRSDTSR